MKESIKISFVDRHITKKHVSANMEAIIAEIERSQCTAESIVVNNASTDDAPSSRGLSRHRDIDEPVKGLVAARSAGYHVATGD